MAVERSEYLAAGTIVRFELQGTLPIFKETYVSPQVGKVVLKGLFNQSAYMELLDGNSYRTLSPRRDKRNPIEIVYPLVHLPDKTEMFGLRMPIKLAKGAVPRLRYATRLDENDYVFKQITAGQRGFELWDGFEMNKLVGRSSRTKLVADLEILAPIPTILALLFPWIDSQTIMYRQP